MISFTEGTTTCAGDGDGDRALREFQVLRFLLGLSLRPSLSLTPGLFLMPGLSLRVPNRRTILSAGRPWALCTVCLVLAMFEAGRRDKKKPDVSRDGVGLGRVPFFLCQ